MTISKGLNLPVENYFFVFQELFVYYDKVLAIYCFVKICKKVLIQNPQDRIEFLFDMDKIIFDKRLTIGQKHALFKTCSIKNYLMTLR